MPNPTFDRRRKEIHTWENRGLAGDANREAVYRVVDGKLELSWEAAQDWFTGRRPPGVPDRTGIFTWWIRRRVDGRMKVVCRAFVELWGKKPKVVKVVEGDAAECRR